MDYPWVARAIRGWPGSATGPEQMDEKKKDDLRKGFPPLQLLTKEQHFLVNELHRLVYNHSCLKLSRWQEKYGKVIWRFWDLLQDRNSKNKEDFMDKERQEQMLRLIVCLAGCLRLLANTVMLTDA